MGPKRQTNEFRMNIMIQTFHNLRIALVKVLIWWKAHGLQRRTDFNLNPGSVTFKVYEFGQNSWTLWPGVSFSVSWGDSLVDSIDTKTLWKHIYAVSEHSDDIKWMIINNYYSLPWCKEALGWSMLFIKFYFLLISYWCLIDIQCFVSFRCTT